MDYLINLSSAIAPSTVKDAVVQRWDLDPQTVYSGHEIDWETFEGPQLIAMVESGLRPLSDFDTEFSAGEAFADVCGRLSELKLTTILCRSLGTRALIPDGGMSGLTWMLVTEDGWHGRVCLEDETEDDAMIITYAYQPVPIAPEIPVEAPPYWQSGWYEDGVIPEAGYLDEA